MEVSSCDLHIQAFLCCVYFPLTCVFVPAFHSLANPQSFPAFSQALVPLMISTLLDNAPGNPSPQKFSHFHWEMLSGKLSFAPFSHHSPQTRKPLDDQFGIYFCPRRSLLSYCKFIYLFIYFFYDQINKYFTIKCFEYSDGCSDCQMNEWWLGEEIWKTQGIGVAK